MALPTFSEKFTLGINQCVLIEIADGEVLHQISFGASGLGNYKVSYVEWPAGQHPGGNGQQAFSGSAFLTGNWTASTDPALKSGIIICSESVPVELFVTFDAGGSSSSSSS